MLPYTLGVAGGELLAESSQIGLWYLSRLAHQRCHIVTGRVLQICSADRPEIFDVISGMRENWSSKKSPKEGAL